MLDEVFFFLEVIFELIILVLVVISLIYYFSAFVEERMKSMTKIMKILNIIILVLSLLLIFSSFSIYLSITIIISNVLWLFILYTDFPYINFLRLDFILAVLATVISHSLLMMHFIKYDEYSSLTTASYFVLYVWIMPILIIISLDALENDEFVEEDSNENENQKSHSYMRLVFTNIIQKVAEFLPHNTDKCD